MSVHPAASNPAGRAGKLAVQIESSGPQETPTL